MAGAGHPAGNHGRQREVVALMVAAGASVEPEWLEREKCGPIHECPRGWAAGKAQRRLGPLARVWARRPLQGDPFGRVFPHRR
jgi:hypothetical protein